ncbi:gluconate 2-dehydrogenase [Pseudomonas duriflava]|uniref:Gluconate 2-dehydrogenase n=1 Tax=Pseudomonas duriflava TaxID=459528 RepID=A0A562QQR6_9PSED|nr:D-glycerate dehydrogenase [Pseudomonas duriflava]TWI58426.1 gluconate 2-dehydrogenase [Pseudomonas duriflava]
MRKNIVVFNRLPAALVQQLSETYNVTVIDPQGDFDSQLKRALPEAHGLIGASKRLGREQLAEAQNLEVISSVSVGYDSYEVDYLTERGIMLTNTPDVLTQTTADLGFALLMSAARRLPELDAYVKAGQWHQSIGEAQFGTDVYGKTLGIIGMGRIGAALAKRGRFGFDMNILYTANSPKPDLEKELDAAFCDLKTLLQSSDFVCLVAPLNESTYHMIGAYELQLMQPSGILINIGRGPLIDEAALYDALCNERIRGAGLDVFEREPLEASPLFSLKNIVTLPHIGSATHETRYAMAERAVANLTAVLNGTRPRDLVNPQAWAD